MKIDKVAEFQNKFGISVLQVSKSMIANLVSIINDVGKWLDLDQYRIEVTMEYLQSRGGGENKKLIDKIKEYIPDIEKKYDEISSHTYHDMCNILFNSSVSMIHWPELVKWMNDHKQFGKEVEHKWIEQFNNGIKERLDFLANYVNLTYYPSFIEGNASTIVHLFDTVCGFSGTMEVPFSLPQIVFVNSEENLLRDRSIDGIVISRFLKYALGEQETNPLNDTTKYVDEAADFIVRSRAPKLIQEIGLRKFIKNQTREVLLACYDAQAIVDGGALLDVPPDDIIDELYTDKQLLDIVQAPKKQKIKTIRWKDHGEWATLDIGNNPIKIYQQHRPEPLQLSTTLTFYDQEHSRGTDAKLSPDALMVNTVGDETRLTEWSQAEGRARQSGKGQTSKSIIAPHTRSQQHGKGPLAIQILRTLIRRSSNSEVSEAFYAHAEQLRSYVRDYFRSAIADALSNHSKSLTSRQIAQLAILSEKLFIHQCDADLSNVDTLNKVARPFEYSTSTKCLETIVEQEIETFYEWINIIESNNEVNNKCKETIVAYLQNGLIKLTDHIIPPASALPDGEIGIPRPGEQSFGIVLNTEIAQEQMVEVETEVDMEVEVDIAQNGDDKELRPEYQPWPSSWYSSPASLWEALHPNSNNIFVSLFNYFPTFDFATISSNVGFWKQEEPYSVPSEIHELNEVDFFWLHDVYVDPFVYHVVLQHPKEGYRVLTVSHQEYSNYIFKLLCKPGLNDYMDGYNDNEQPYISVYRHEGWGWVCFDSTKSSLDNTCLTVNPHSNLTKRILSECLLLSGNVEIGNIIDQLTFLQIFADSIINETIDEIIMRTIRNDLPTYFTKTNARLIDTFLFSITTIESVIIDKSERISKYEEIIEQFDDAIKLIAKRYHFGTIEDLINAINTEIAKILSDVFIKQILTKKSDPNWMTIILLIFGNDKSRLKLHAARCQIRVITGRHRCSIAKKLPTSPMWRLVNALLDKLKDSE